MYAYCENNPINNVDPSGEFFTIVALSSFATKVILGVLAVCIVANLANIVAETIDYVSQYGSTGNPSSNSNTKPNSVVTIASPNSDGNSPNDDNFDNRLNSNTTNANKGYKSFRQAKKAMGPAGKGRDWHHIVEQCQVKKSGFDVQMINNEKNLISIDKGLHRKISGYYGSIDPEFCDTMKIRDWLAGQSYQAQYEFGLNVIKMFGGM